MEGFQVTEIGEKIYCILDAGNSSFYVVEGVVGVSYHNRDPMEFAGGDEGPEFPNGEGI